MPVLATAVMPIIRFPSLVVTELSPENAEVQMMQNKRAHPDATPNFIAVFEVQPEQFAIEYWNQRDLS